MRQDFLNLRNREFLNMRLNREGRYFIAKLEAPPTLWSSTCIEQIGRIITNSIFLSRIDCFSEGALFYCEKYFLRGLGKYVCWSDILIFVLRRTKQGDLLLKFILKPNANFEDRPFPSKLKAVAFILLRTCLQAIDSLWRKTHNRIAFLQKPAFRASQ